MPKENEDYVAIPQSEYEHLLDVRQMYIEESNRKIQDCKNEIQSQTISSIISYYMNK